MNAIKETILVFVSLCLTANAEKCIPIEKSVCKDIGIPLMRVPNFVGHDEDDETEIYRELGRWQLLIASGCHEGLTKFLCSMYTPICLRVPIKPCKSLCEDVRKNCEPLMNIHNFSWPSVFNCSNFEDNSLCVKHESNATTTERPTTSSTIICKTNSLKLRDLKKLYCRSEFAVKGKVLETKANRDNSQLIIKIEVLKYLRGRGSRRARIKGRPKIRVPQIYPHNCNAYSKRPYIIIGKQKGRKAFASAVLKWKKYRKLLKNTRCSN